MDKQTLKTKLKQQAKQIAWRAITTVILTLTAVVTFWVYAAFVEPAVGPNNSLQDFAQNILGANNNDNGFNSSSVIANADGSIIERQEYQQAQIGTYTDATSTPSAATSVFAALKGQRSPLYYQEYTSGSGDWTVPAGISFVNVIIVAGGGGGGGTLSGSRSGGGGGGEVIMVVNSKVTAGATIAYSVGIAGTGGTAGDNNGVSGGNSSFGSFTAYGGAGGSKGSVKTGGKGGSSLTGGAGGAADTDGSNGASLGMIFLGRIGGGGGGGAYGATKAGAGGLSVSAGGAGYAGSGGGGGGGSWGVGADAQHSDGDGHAASANTGGGGSGAYGFTGVSRAGGDGGSGYILITW